MSAATETPEAREQAEALAAPFRRDEVKFKPAAVSGNRALALAYVDARAIQDRLDLVVGVAGWSDEYEMLPDGSALCRLKVRLGGEWVTKMDVGSPSEQPDEHDRVKAAVSDALKRAAVKFGIGRYLYRLLSQWADYDPKKRQFTAAPSLPPEALPARGKHAARPANAPAETPLRERADLLRKANAPLKYSWADALKLLGKPEGTGLGELPEADYRHLIDTLERQAREAAPAK